MEREVSLFNKPGLYLRNPRGGVEDVANMRNAGFHYIAVNVGDHSMPEWDAVLNRAEQAGVPVMPWMRCLHEPAVTRLCALARAMPAKAVLVNSEDELFSGAVTLSHIAQECKGLDAALSCQPWTADLPLNQVSALAIHLQMFPQESEVSTRPRDCRARAFKNGGRRVNFMLGIHDIGPNVLPPRQAGYSIYTADDCGNDFGPWMPSTPPSLDIKFQGALYPYDHSRYVRGKSPERVKALKRAMHRAGFGDFGALDGTYGPKLKAAMQAMQRTHGFRSATGSYGASSHLVLMTLLAAQPDSGYALDEEARAWMEM